MNLVVISGRLTKEIEIKVSEKTGKEYAIVSVANNEDREKPVFINGVISGKSLDFAKMWIKPKGRVIITGKLTEYKKDGEKYGTLKVNIERMEPIDWKESNKDEVKHESPKDDDPF